MPRSSHRRLEGKARHVQRRSLAMTQHARLSMHKSSMKAKWKWRFETDKSCCSVSIRASIPRCSWKLELAMEVFRIGLQREGDCLEDCTTMVLCTVPVSIGYVTDSAAAERSDGYRLGFSIFCNDTISV